MSLGVVLSGALAGLGDSYANAQEQKHQEKLAKTKMQYEALSKMATSPEVLPSDRAQYATQALQTIGIDPTKPPTQSAKLPAHQAINQMIQAAGHPELHTPPPPPVMDQIGLPDSSQGPSLQAPQPPPGMNGGIAQAVQSGTPQAAVDRFSAPTPPSAVAAAQSQPGSQAQPADDVTAMSQEARDEMQKLYGIDPLNMTPDEAFTYKQQYGMFPRAAYTQLVHDKLVQRREERVQAEKDAKEAAKVPKVPPVTEAGMKDEFATLDAKTDRTTQEDARLNSLKKVLFPEKPASTTAPRTVTVGDRVKQWNPATQKFDIDVGPKETTGAGTQDQATTVAEGIQSGDLPPQLSEVASYRDRTAVSAALAKSGYNLAEAERDWKAINRFMGTLNGVQQTRLRQAIQFTNDSIPQIESLFQEWNSLGKQSGFKVLNKANLAVAKQLPGHAGAVASALEAQIADLTSELGTVYKGGNSSTDESLRLAAQNLQTDWNSETVQRQLNQIRKSLRIRSNSILTSRPSGVSDQSPYMPAPPPGVNGVSAPSGMIQARDQNGKLHQAPAGTPLPAGWTLEKK